MAIISSNRWLWFACCHQTQPAAQVSFCNYCEIFKNTYFEKHLRTTASVFAFKGLMLLREPSDKNHFKMLIGKLGWCYKTFFVRRLKQNELHEISRCKIRMWTPTKTSMNKLCKQLPWNTNKSQFFGGKSVLKT